MRTLNATLAKLRGDQASAGNQKTCDQPTSPPASTEGIGLFDVVVQLQTAGLHDQGSPAKSNLIRGALSRLRESPPVGQTQAGAKPETDVSRDLALAFLLSSDDQKPK